MKSFSIGTLSLLLSTVTYGFTLNSSTNPNFRGWDNPEIRFNLNLTNCPVGVDVRGIIDDALAVWNNVPSSRIHLSVNGDTTSTTYGDPITVVCDTNYMSGTPGAQDGSPGAAVVQPTNGDAITSGIMYLNASSGRANIANLSRSLVAVVLAHEIGHLLGLGHSQDINALMYYDASLKTTLGLAQDDVDGVTYLYPRDELGKDKPLGCASIQSPKPPTTGQRLVLLICLLFPVAVWTGLRNRLRMS